MASCLFCFDTLRNRLKRTGIDIVIEDTEEFRSILAKRGLYDVSINLEMEMIVFGYGDADQPNYSVVTRDDEEISWWDTSEYQTERDRRLSESFWQHRKEWVRNGKKGPSPPYEPAPT